MEYSAITNTITNSIQRRHGRKCIRYFQVVFLKQISISRLIHIFDNAQWLCVRLLSHAVIVQSTDTAFSCLKRKSNHPGAKTLASRSHWSACLLPSVFHAIHSYSRNNNSHLFHRFPPQPQSRPFQIIPLDPVSVMTLLMADPPEPLWEGELGSPDQAAFTLLGTWLCKLPPGLPSPSSAQTEYK